MLATIGLENIRFKAFHGYYADEQRLGGYYHVTLRVVYDIEKAATTDDLSDAVNYEGLYEICAKQMAIPYKLIETLALNILDDVMDLFSSVESAKIDVRKLSPPLAGDVESAYVIMERKRN